MGVERVEMGCWRGAMCRVVGLFWGCFGKECEFLFRRYDAQYTVFWAVLDYLFAYLPSVWDMNAQNGVFCGCLVEIEHLLQSDIRAWTGAIGNAIVVR